MFMAKFTFNHLQPDTFANFAKCATSKWNQYFNPSKVIDLQFQTDIPGVIPETQDFSIARSHL